MLEHFYWFIFSYLIYYFSSLIYPVTFFSYITFFSHKIQMGILWFLFFCWYFLSLVGFEDHRWFKIVVQNFQILGHLKVSLPWLFLYYESHFPVVVFFLMSNNLGLYPGNCTWYIVWTLDRVIFLWRVLIFVCLIKQLIWLNSASDFCLPAVGSSWNFYPVLFALAEPLGVCC